MSTKITVGIATYNQEAYIQDCIKSILNQTYQDFEIVINNDASTDNTWEKILEIKDSRIRVNNSEYNRGINASLNTLIEMAQGEYFVFLGGDDMLAENHLETVLKFFENNKDLDVAFIGHFKMDKDKNLRKYEKDNARFFDGIKDDLLHYGLIKGNFGFSPGMTIRMSVLNKIMPLPCSVVNFQDVKIHYELLAAGAKFGYIRDKLVYYRVSGSNISKQGLISELRTKFETDYLMDAFLKIKDVALLEKSFAQEIKQTGIKPYPDTIPYFLGRMAMLSTINTRIVWGYHKIIEFMANQENFDLIKERYGLEYRDFLKLADCQKYFIYKYKKYFNVTLVIAIIMAVFALIFAGLFVIKCL